MADLNSFKSIVSTFNHTSMNDKLEDSFKLIQEITKRFEITYGVVQRFPKSMKNVCLPIENGTGNASAKLQKALNSLEQKIDGNEVLHPLLDATIHCFFGRTRSKQLATSSTQHL